MANKELIDNLIEGLEYIKENADKYDIEFTAEPSIEEFYDSTGKGERHILYTRTITIMDNQPKVEKISKIIW